MELKITTKQERPLLSRTDVHAEITFAGATPSTPVVKKEIAKQTKTTEEPPTDEKTTWQKIKKWLI